MTGPDQTPAHGETPKRGADGDYVRTLFGDIAWRYDALNHLLSFGVDRTWRKAAVAAALERRPARILDVATGTADLALALKRRAPYAEVIGVDFTEAMLELGRSKARKQHVDVALMTGDGQALAFEDASFDALTIAYGLRNFSDRERGLREFYRVLRPGGRLVVLEFPPPPKGLFGRLLRFYTFRVMPLLAGYLSGRRDAYVYLSESVMSFPPPDVLADMMRRAGFSGVTYSLQTLGISALHVGDKGLGDKT